MSSSSAHHPVGSTLERNSPPVIMDVEGEAARLRKLRGMLADLGMGNDMRAHHGAYGEHHAAAHGMPSKDTHGSLAPSLLPDANTAAEYRRESDSSTSADQEWSPPGSNSTPSLAQSDSDRHSAQHGGRAGDGQGGAEVTLGLTADDVQFSVRHAEAAPPTVDELRARILDQFPQLVLPPEPAHKQRAPHAPPPAVDHAVRAQVKLQNSSDAQAAAERKARERALIVTVEDVVEKSVIRGQVLLESREGHWQKIAAAAPEDATDAQKTITEELPTLPSPWLLPLRTAELIAPNKSKAKKVLELPDYRLTTTCWGCHGTAKTACKACAGVSADECFWCEGTGQRRGKVCEGCGGGKLHACAACGSSGTVACGQCEQRGTLFVGYFVDVRLRRVDLPPIPLESMTHPLTRAHPATAREVEECARAKMVAAMHKINAEQARRAVPAVPVQARCVWLTSAKRTVSVFRPFHVDVPKSKASKLKGKAEAAEDDADLQPHASTKGELRNFLVPSDAAMPVLELFVGQTPGGDSPGSSRRGSKHGTPVGTPGGPFSPTPTDSFFHTPTSPGWWSPGSRSRRSSFGALASPASTPAAAAGQQTLAVPGTPGRAPDSPRMASSPLATGGSGGSAHSSGRHTPAPSVQSTSKRAGLAAIFNVRRRKSVPELKVYAPATPLTPAHVGTPRRGSAHTLGRK